MVDKAVEEPQQLRVSAMDHVAVAVPDLGQAISLYRDRFGAEVSEPITVPEQAIRIAYVRLANARIELMQPLSEDSPVGKFLARHPDGGLHHICLTTEDVATAHSAAEAQDLRPLKAPAKGHHGRLLFFLHPKTTQGTLVEIEETRAASELTPQTSGAA